MRSAKLVTMIVEVPAPFNNYDDLHPSSLLIDNNFIGKLWRLEDASNFVPAEPKAETVSDNTKKHELNCAN